MTKSKETVTSSAKMNSRISDTMVIYKDFAMFSVVGVFDNLFVMVNNFLHDLFGLSALILLIPIHRIGEERAFSFRGFANFLSIQLLRPSERWCVVVAWRGMSPPLRMSVPAPRPSSRLDSTGRPFRGILCAC